jgi:hypothetical protein
MGDSQPPRGDVRLRSNVPTSTTPSGEAPESGKYLAVEMTFERWEDARDALAEGVGLHAESDQLDIFVDGVTDSLEHRTPSSRRHGLILRNWVVRDDDIDLTQHLSDGIVAAAASSFFSAGPTLPSITGSAVALFRALRDVYSKGVRLPPRDLTILLHVKRFGPLTARELLDGLGPAFDMTRQDLRDVLDRLSRITVQDGSIVSLVERDGSKRWTTTC